MTPEQLFEENMKFAYFFANRFQGLADLDELHQLALVGLYRAACRFKPELEIKFTTYASHYIRKEIVRNYEKNSFIHISRPVQEAIAMIKKHDYYDTPIEDIMERTYLSRGAIERAFTCLEMQAASLDAVMYKYSDSVDTLHDMIADPFISDWDNDILRSDFISSLTEREQFVVKMRMEDKPQTEIGKALGVSQMQVSRILKKIQQKYRAMEVELV